MGQLIYSENGFMSVHLSQFVRPLFQAESVFDVTAEEAFKNYSTYHSYCGRYEVIGNKILHYIQMSSCPNWDNSIREREFKIMTNKLYLSHQLDGKDSELIWEKQL